MSFQYFMPTKVIIGKNCIDENKEVFSSLGKKALIVTGKHSSKANGSLDDVISALTSQGISYDIFDKINSNPDISSVYSGADFAKEIGAEFIIAIGGGSPMDAGKAIALLSAQDVKEEELFAGNYETKILPTAFVPTTAGTGSEVTQYSVLTNNKAKTKTTLATPFMFPTIAFLDAKYMSSLSKTTTINTCIDALSHLIESYLSVKSNYITKSLCLDGISKISDRFAKVTNFELSEFDREQLLIASTLGGMVIAQTGTTVVHSMGYSLTYFKHIDHGRANGLIISEFLKFIQADMPDDISEVLSAMGLESIDEFQIMMENALGEKEDISKEELMEYSEIAIKAKNIYNCKKIPTQEDLYKMYCNVFSK